MKYSKEEKQVIKNLCLKQELSEEQLLRKALRTYQLIVEGEAELKMKKDLKPFGEYRG